VGSLAGGDSRAAGDRACLETYEQERRKHAWEMILLALRMGQSHDASRFFSSAFALQAAFSFAERCATRTRLFRGDEIQA